MERGANLGSGAVLVAADGGREAVHGRSSGSVSEPRTLSHTHAHTLSSQNRPAPRTDGGNGDSDRGDKQRGEIWRQEEAGSQNKSGGSRGMEDRMKLTDIKTARTHRESFPFLIAHIQRLVGAGERAGLAGGANPKTAQKSETFLNPLGAYQAFFFFAF